jgi:tetratricopeptide (TPR) repeat protein
VTANPTLRTWGGLGDIWLRPTATPQYYPLVHTTYWLEYRLWGLHPAGYHAVNVGLHFLTSVVLWRILALLGVPGAWLGAALFAVHPVGVESVAWVTERKNTLSGLFAAVAVWQWLQWRFAPPTDDPRAAAGTDAASRRKAYGLATAAFAAAMLSKTVSITLVGVLPVIAWWKRGRLERPDLVSMLPWLAIGLPLALLTVWMEKTHVGAVGAAFALTPAERILVAGRAICFYAGKLLWPHPLLFFYERWELDAAAPWQWAFPAAVGAVAGTLWLARSRTGRGPLAVLLLFAGLLFPALGFFDVYPFQFSYVADHFQYHAAAAFLAGVAAGFALLFSAESAPAGLRRVSLPLAAAVLLGLAGLSARQCTFYKDEATLYGHVLAHVPTSWCALNNLGFLEQSGGHPRAAEQLFERAAAAAATAEQRSRSLACLARLHLEEDRVPAAVDAAATALKTHRYPGATAMYCLAATRSGDLESARRVLANATAMERSHFYTRLAEGELALRSGRLANGEKLLQAARRDHPQIALEAAIALANAGLETAAEAVFLELAADPARAGRALVNLGVLRARRGDLRSARVAFERAWAIDPGCVMAREAVAKIESSEAAASRISAP